MNSNNLAISCRHLTKTYFLYKKQPGFWGSIRSLFRRQTIEKVALKPLDLEIKPGEIVGLLGANGAGKTTLMKMLSGIVVPTDGQVQVFDETPAQRRNSFKRKIALVMGQKNQLQWDLPALDSFHLIKEYYEIPTADFKNRLSELTELLDVKDILNIQIRRLSLGERMKVEIMACLLHAPKLILLDEPTIGLDVYAQERLRQFFRDYRETHKPTIVLTSHYMVDIVSLCPRVVLLNEGQKIFDGPREKLTGLLGQKKRLHLIFERGRKLPRNHQLLAAHNPHWINDDEVELDIHRDQFRKITAELLLNLPIYDFSTDEVPFEAVMEKILKEPELLQLL